MRHSKILTALEGECWDTSESNNKPACLVPPGISGEQQFGEWPHAIPTVAIGESQESRPTFNKSLTVTLKNG